MYKYLYINRRIYSMQKFLKLVLIFVVLFSVVKISKSQQTTSFLSVKIMDDKKKPIKGVNVQIIYLPWNKIINLITDEKGKFNIGNLPPGGSYNIKFICDGFFTLTIEDLSLDLGSNRFNYYLQQRPIKEHINS